MKKTLVAGGFEPRYRYYDSRITLVRQQRKQHNSISISAQSLHSRKRRKDCFIMKQQYFKSVRSGPTSYPLSFSGTNLIQFLSWLPIWNCFGWLPSLHSRLILFSERVLDFVFIFFILLRVKTLVPCSGETFQKILAGAELFLLTRAFQNQKMSQSLLRAFRIEPLFLTCGTFHRLS